MDRGSGIRSAHFATDHARWIEFPGLALLIASTGFTIWARLKLGRMWSASPNMLRANHELRTDGPYAITRHPIYTGLLGMLLGTLLVNGLGVSLALLGVAAVFLVTRIPIEERLMSRTFPTSTLATANACLASSPASTGCADRTEGAVEVHAHRRIAPTRSMIRCSRASFERRSHRA
jgi:hypothetical protein